MCSCPAVQTRPESYHSFMTLAVITTPLEVMYEFLYNIIYQEKM